MDGRAILTAVALAMASGCGGGGGPPPLSTGLAGATGAQPESPMPPIPKPVGGAGPKSGLEEMLRQSALDTQRALDELNTPAAAADPTPEPEAPVRAPRPAAPASRAAAATEGLATSGSGATPATTAPEGGATPLNGATHGSGATPVATAPESGAANPVVGPAPETREALAERLSSMVREHAGAAPDPWTDLLTLAGLDTAAPGGLAAQVGASKGLGEDQKRALLAIPALLAAMPVDADAARVLAERASALADQLADLRPLAVRAELCTRVVGFGSYTAFGTNRFPAGAEQRAIVYVEVANLPQRELGATDTSPARQPGDRYLVDLTQETNLYNESGSLLALHIPEQRLTETSRNRRRDFFLVSRVTLPPSLSIGLYNLKVTVRDRVTGAQAEASIPIEIVAGR
ncbi:MAG: hypothetical protein IT437_14150 [Phycisphaerales bacterium]|nr:hypothetical protein [Phycisphaerales bacterium]